MSYPGKWDSLRGKRSRTSMVNKLIKDAGGRIKIEDLEKYLRARGYHLLIGKLETMGFSIIDGYVQGQGHVHG